MWRSAHLQEGCNRADGTLGYHRLELVGSEMEYRTDGGLGGGGGGIKESPHLFRLSKQMWTIRLPGELLHGDCAHLTED